MSNLPPDPVRPVLAPSGGDDTAALLRRWAAGDRRAFRTVYERWGPRLHGIALRITGQPSLAADATHDAFVQVWQQAGRFDPARGSAEAFLVSLLRYRALDIVRRHGREVPGMSAPFVLSYIFAIPWNWVDAIVRVILTVILMTLLVLGLTYIERKVIARIQLRLGPTRTGPAGLLQPVDLLSGFLEVLFEREPQQV